LHRGGRFTIIVNMIKCEPQERGDHRARIFKRLRSSGIDAKAGRGWRGVLSCVEYHILQELTLCFLPDSVPTKLQHHPKQKPRSGGGPQADKFLLQVNNIR
jgi:hypothetical protein